jgi:ribosomal protein S27E
VPSPSEFLNQNAKKKQEDRTECHMSINCVMCDSEYTRIFYTADFGVFDVDCAVCGRTGRINMGWEPPRV